MRVLTAPPSVIYLRKKKQTKMLKSCQVSEWKRYELRVGANVKKSSYNIGLATKQ